MNFSEPLAVRSGRVLYGGSELLSIYGNSSPPYETRRGLTASFPLNSPYIENGLYTHHEFGRNISMSFIERRFCKRAYKHQGLSIGIKLFECMDFLR